MQEQEINLGSSSNDSMDKDLEVELLMEKFRKTEEAMLQAENG